MNGLSPQQLQLLLPESMIVLCLQFRRCFLLAFML